MGMLTGTLDDFDLRHVFRLLSFAHKTGKLSVAGPVGGGRIFFRAGHVYHAESDVLREGFGRKLVKAGRLTELELRRTLEYCAVHRTGLGDALVTRGLVSQQDLEAALREEIEEVVLGLFHNDRGSFSFEDDELADSDTAIQLHVESLIQEESDTVRRRVPALNPAFVKASISAGTTSGTQMEISITWEEWSLIALIDGRRTIGEIAAQLGADETSVTHGLRRLLTVGLVTLAEGELEGPDEASPPSDPGHVAAPVEERQPSRPPPPPPDIDVAAEEAAWIREGRS
jgi:DNA-binding transcriptional ArsR family regulator